MKKESNVVQEQKAYKISVIINNIALMYSATGKSGLVNIKTNEIIGSFDDYYTIYDTNNKLYYQEKSEYVGKGNNCNTKSTVVKIYDAENERVIADRLIKVHSLEGYYQFTILQNPENGKYYLFRGQRDNKNSNMLSEEYDEINYLRDYYGEKFLSFKKDGKTALFSSIRGWITDFDYENIESFGGAFIYTQGEKQFFSYIKSSKDELEKSEMFDSIIPDEKNKKIFYCKKGDQIDIYSIENWRCELLFTAYYCDEMHYFNKNIFFIKKQGKDGLAGPKEGLILSPIYDSIENKDGDFYLHKDGKVGLYQYNSSGKSYFIEAEYDNIIPVSYYSQCFAFCNGETCDIKSIKNMEKTLVQNCKIEKKVGSNVIFEKSGKKGLFIPSRDEKYLILEGLDDIEYLDNSLYRIETNGKNGIFFDDKVIIKPIYRSINSRGISRYGSEVIYFALERNDGKFDFGRLKKGRYCWDDATMEISNGEPFEDIKLLDGIIALKDKDSCSVFDYANNLLKVLPKDTEIKEVPEEENDSARLYLVNGEYYFYSDKKFEPALMENCNKYVTTYEYDYGTLVVNSYDRDAHDNYCRKLEEKTDEEIEETMFRRQGNKDKESGKYPTLVKKI